jgi:hypothetical protein
MARHRVALLSKAEGRNVTIEAAAGWFRTSDLFFRR